MRIGALLLTLTLWVPLAGAPAALAAQTTRSSEKFDVSGLPKTPTTALEKEIFLLLKVHKKGDLSDATRIHVKLAEYYREKGDKVRAGDCTKSAESAWLEASGDTPKASANSPGTPPFDTENAFEGKYVYVDSLQVEHRWNFYSDGTYAHRASPTRPMAVEAPAELGWYTLVGDRIRLWQLQPKGDRTVSFQLAGESAILNGATMKLAK